MNKEIISSVYTEDSCIHVKHTSGLDIYICEMPEFSGVEAQLGVKYGSVNKLFRIEGDKDFSSVPEGIAHFLEHKLFENEDSQVFELYAETGASGNALTSFDKTCYTFSCTQNYQKNLRILLDFIQKPYFTQENIDKEIGIISQEIQMSNDNPNWRIFFNMMKCMYHNHPIRTDIAGTLESIRKIDADMLYKCYNTFYNLNNMALSIAGNVNANEVLAICDEMLKPCENIKVECIFPDEPESIVSPEIREVQDIGTSIFSFGFKCTPPTNSTRTLKIISAAITGELLSDPSSELYQRLIKENIINSTFGYELLCGNGYFSFIFSGESESPEIIMDNIIKEIEHMAHDGIPENDFKRFKKSFYASFVCELNNVEIVAKTMLDAYLNDIPVFDRIDTLSKLTSSDVLDFIRSELLSDKLVLSVIERKVN